ncbi:MAG: hypothetical protein IJ711_05425, partial [Lachnospiraceae bacterium]|nr:hypothetical protein [Lachnospiraceae bacterium]
MKLFLLLVCAALSVHMLSAEISTAEAAKNAKTLSPSIKLKGINAVKVSWKKVDGATEYRVYRAKRKDSGSDSSGARWTNYKLLAVLSRDAKSYVDTRCKLGEFYSYKISAYKKVGGKKKLVTQAKASRYLGVSQLQWDQAQAHFHAYFKENDVFLYWDGHGIMPDGYEIYRKEKGSSYQKIKTVYDWNHGGGKENGKRYTDKKLKVGKNGKFYYYKARFFTYLDGKKLYGAYSEPLKLLAVNKAGKFSVKLITERVGDTPEVIVAIKSDKYNGTLSFDQESFLLTTAKDLKEIGWTDDLDWELEKEDRDDMDWQLRTVVERSQVLKLNECSTDGKTYKKFVKSEQELKAGGTIYLKLVKADGGSIDLTGNSLALYACGVTY